MGGRSKGSTGLSGMVKKSEGFLNQRGLSPEVLRSGAISPVGGLLAFANQKSAQSDKERREARKEEQRQIEKLRKDQEKRDKQIQDLFQNKEFQQMPDVEKDKILARIDQIGTADTKELRDLAGADVGRLREIASAEGTSAVGQRLLGLQEEREGQRLEQLEEESALRGQTAIEGLLSRGGGGAAARERLMGQTGRQSLIESQRARREGDIQVSRIQAEDEARKLDLAKALPSQQLSLAQAQLAEQQAAAQIGLGKAAEARQASQFAQAAKAQNMATQVAALQESAQRAGQFGASQLLAKKQQSQADKARGGLFGQIGTLIS